MIPFYLFAAVAVAASLLVIAQRNPIYSVLLLIASFGALSGLYVLLDAPFVAVIQIIVYAGGFKSMTTKRNSTMIAPAYTMIWMTATNGASSSTYRPDSAPNEAISSSTLYTGFRWAITRMEATIATAPNR